MAAKVHHLNCGTMCPIGGRALTGSGGVLVGRIVAHCLLVETGRGLVLVDTGLGTGDIANPRRLGRIFQTNTRPLLASTETALHQVRALGFSASDVRDILVTHLDPDHAGGLGDFPEARVHLSGAEHAAGLRPPSAGERLRYRSAQWAHQPNWVTHEVTGERWFGFDAVRAIDETEPDVLLVPLTGHTRGHCGVAVRTDSGWLLHAGDAYMHRGELDTVRPSCPPALALLQRLVETDRPARLRNQQRLRELNRDHAGEVRVFSAHDPVELAALAGNPAPR